MIDGPGQARSGRANRRILASALRWEDSAGRVVTSHHVVKISPAAVLRTDSRGHEGRQGGELGGCTDDPEKRRCSLAVAVNLVRPIRSDGQGLEVGRGGWCQDFSFEQKTELCSISSDSWVSSFFTLSVEASTSEMTYLE